MPDHYAKKRWFEDSIRRASYPVSWIYFVLAHIHGKHRTLAVATREAETGPDDEIQGVTLVAECRSLVAIFSEDAVTVFEAFLIEAKEGLEKLRVAMREITQEYSWYLELLDEQTRV